MAEIINIEIKYSGFTGDKVINDLKKIKTGIDTLNNSKIKLNIEGLQAADKATLKTAKSFSDLAKNIYKLEVQHTKLSIQQEKTAQTANRLATQQEKTATAYAKASAQAKAHGETLQNLITRYASLTVVITKTIQYVREALTTMREVDQQLTNIQKVSNMTSDEIKRLGDSAYETASKYGVAADKYLEAVYTFQKAGLGDSAEKLGELATKTMLVGDTTAAVATKFLISANAAWKLGGSVEALSKIVDEADYINNNYATTLEDIATGLPIVGATAAQVGMTAEQTMAAIGTIVASTGQSASKASTALRAIIMNLIGQTGELDEGVSVTEESIKSLNDVLVKYAPNALAAAQASGKILDPMEAIAALAKAAEDPLVKDTELFTVLASLGGKLRTTQLTALVNNTETYKKMLEGTATAAGTADKEVSVMLESWNSKVQILKNTWTQFVSHLIDSGAIKTLIDVGTRTLKILDKIITFGGIIKTGLKAVVTALKVVEGILSGIGTVWDATVGKLAGLFKDAEPSAEAHLKTAEELNKQYSEAQDEIASLHDKIESNNTLIAKTNELIKQGNSVADNTAYAERLANENALLQAQIEAQEALAAKAREQEHQEAVAAWNAKDYEIKGKKYTTASGGTMYADTRVTAQERAYYILEQMNALSAYGQNAEANAPALDAYNRELEKIIASLEGISQHLDASSEEGKEYASVLSYITRRWKLFNGIVVDTEETVDTTTGAIEEQKEVVEEAVDAFKAYNDAIDSVQSALNTLTAAQEEYNQNGELSVDTIQSLLALDAEYLDALIDENGQINLNSEAVSDLMDGKNVLIERLAAEAIATYAVEEAQRMTESQYGKTGSAADTASSKMYNAAAAMIATRDDALNAIPALKGYWAALYGIGTEYGMSDETFEVFSANVDKYKDNVIATFRNVGLGLSGWSSKGSGSSSRSGSSGSSTDTTLAAHKSAVSLAKQKLSFASESGASTAEQVALMRAVQDELHKQADYMRSIGAEEEDILKLSTEWWTYQNKITKALEESKEDYEAIKDAAIARIDAEEARVIGPLQQQLELLKAQRDAVQDEREEEERLLEVEKARIALENAQRERTVRQYNAATGQWEWVANAANVNSARENLTQAETALSDYYRDKEIATLEAKIADIQSGYEQKRVIAQMQANSAAWFDADASTRKSLAAENLKLGTAQGWTRGADGVWYDASGRRVYDGGGILRGVGGIKATHGAEMVLPPSMTSRLLTAEASGAFNALLNHLGIVTSAANSYAGFGGGLTRNSIGEQHNGDTFYIDGIMMQNITASTTLGDLARAARTLELRKGA